MAMSEGGWRPLAQLKTLGLLPLLLIALLTSPGAAASAGKVLMASGDTSRIAADGARSALQAGDAVFSGDTLFTGAESRLQWRTNDGGMFALRPNSEFRVDEYQYDAAKGSGRSFFSLAKGGFRTLTGSIGKKQHDRYRVTTPVATLGIRGTHYVVQLCLAGAAAAAAGCAGVVPGLYLGTIAGAVLVGNAADSLQVNANQSAFVGALSSPPELLPVTPGMLKDTVLPRGRGGSPPPRVVTPRGGGPSGPVLRPPPPRLPKLGLASEGGVTNLSNGSLPLAPVAEEPTTDPVVETTGESSSGPVVATVEERFPIVGRLPGKKPDPGTVVVPIVVTPLPKVLNPGVHSTAVASGPVGLTPLHTSSGTVPVLNIAEVKKEPNLGFSGLYDIAAPASVVDRGEDPGTGIYWGRILDGTFNVPGIDAAGKPTPRDGFDERSLHYVSGTRPFDASLPITGTASYAVIGATSPTDSFGQVGSLTDAALHADFSNQTVSVDLAVSLNSTSWTVSSAGVPLNAADAVFDGSVPVAVGVAGSNAPPLDGFGEVSGFFAGQPVTAGDAPPGAGLSYSLTDGGSQTVSGVAAFELQ